MEHKKILVSGGLGFVGYHLTKRLLKEGHHVEIVDNLRSNVIEKDHFKKEFSSQHKVVVKDIKDYEPSSRFDEFYHLASIVGPAGILPFANVLGYEELINAKKCTEISLKSGARLIFISSSEVYGPVKTCIESGECIIPPKQTVRLVYGLGKLTAEHFFFNQAKISDLKFNVIRPFNIVGEYQSSETGFVLPRFFEAALKDKDIPVFGDGEQLRTFTYVNDIVSGMVTVMNSNVENEIFNVGNPNNLTSILDLAKRIKKACDSSSEITLVDPKAIYGDLFEGAYNKVADITKIKTVFEWKPKYSLDNIFAIMKDFYEKKEKQEQTPPKPPKP